MTELGVTRAQLQEFRHEALLYAGDDGFLQGTVPFIQDGISLGEVVLVVVDSRKIALLSREFDGAARDVVFADMAEVGRNPARIIPVWRAFVAGIPAGRGARGIGEPIFPSRTPAELVECQIHESLLNIAFRDAPAWWLICPYNTDVLPTDVIDEALHSHPSLIVEEGRRHSPGYSDSPPNPLGGPPLPPAPIGYDELAFAEGELGTVRAFVGLHAPTLGLAEPSRVTDLTLAVHELAANSVRHGGGRGTLRIWPENGEVVCEVQDAGAILHPLVGRGTPPLADESGRGLWLVNHRSDLTRLRSSADGTVVRIHMAVAAA